MCGIAGKLDFERPPELATVDKMCRALEHRGPDSHGFHCDGPIAFGARRLAIIDIPGGDQPISSEDGRVTVVMNGEIYNASSLREDLRRRGHRFRSRVDTEVLVHLYEEHGDQVVDQLQGMFAFAIWDSRRYRLFCARDRLGKKPFFWTRRGSSFWFASELGALVSDSEIPRIVDAQALSIYLGLLHIPHPMTIFQGIQKLPPAHTLSVDVGGLSVRRYWRLKFEPKLRTRAPELIEEELRQRVAEATRVRMVADVPVGAYLSGGVDSTVVVANMAALSSKPLKTFSIAWREASHDETRYARLVAERFGTEHHEMVVQPQAARDLLPALARHYGEPFADPSAVPSFKLADLARRHAKVLLNGDGGDESFSGYPRYGRHLAPFSGRGAGAEPRSLLRRMSQRLAQRDIAGALALGRPRSSPRNYAFGFCAFDALRQRELLNPDLAVQVDVGAAESWLTGLWRRAPARNDVDRMISVDIENYLSAQLMTKTDIATMAHSIEARSPLMDHTLVEFAATIPAELKRDQSGGKLVLRRAYRGIVPDEVLDRPKMGFGAPMAHWFRNSLGDLPEELLTDATARQRGYFQPAEVERLIREHKDSRWDHSERIWALIQLEAWHRYWLN